MAAWKIKYTCNFPLVIAPMPHLHHIHHWYQYLPVFKQIIMIFPSPRVFTIFVVHYWHFFASYHFWKSWVMNKMSIDTSLWNKSATLFQEKGAGTLNRVSQRIPRKNVWARLLQEITERLIPTARTQFPWICGTQNYQEGLWDYLTRAESAH